MRYLRLLIGFISGGLLCLPALAAEFPSTPIPRVEVEMHTAMIRRMAISEARRIIVTASDDKTARVFDLDTGRLVSVLRVPIGPGQEGRLFALALDGAGNTAAVAGWTGVTASSRFSVYLFDPQSGEMKGRIPDLPGIIGYLAFSHDGEYLAVGLGNAKGLRIYRSADLTFVAGDADYRERIAGLDFAPDGRLAASALDGFVRLYDKHFARIAKVEVTNGPVEVRFSPDGQRLAAGFIGEPKVAVLDSNSSSNLSFLYWATVPDKRQINLPGVAWSRDSRFLYACGDLASGSNPIYRWDEDSKTAPTAFKATNQRITAIVPLADGRVAYSTEDPVIGFVNDQGNASVFKERAIAADFRDIESALRLSDDGSVVQFAYRRGGRRIAHFSLAQGETVLGPMDAKMAAAKTPAVTLNDWKDSYRPKLNGKPLPLDSYELSRSRAFSPDGKTLLLGSEWGLRLFDENAKKIWSVELAEIPWGLAFSGDGKFAVAALSDGTIRWYRASDGAQLFALFPHSNGQAWIAWTPQGYYDSSEYGDNFIGWHVNRADGQRADFYRAVQFERLLYRRGLPIDLIETLRAGRSYSTDPDSGFDIHRLQERAPPRIRIDSLAAHGRKAVLKFSAQKNRLPMREYTIFVNNIPITPFKERGLMGEESKAFSRNVELDVFSKDNVIRVEISNGSSLGVAERYLATAAEGEAPSGNLYVLAVGVNRFPNAPARKLGYAAHDADEIGKFFGSLAGGQYRQVYAKVLSDNALDKPDKTKVMEALEFLRESGANDTVILFLASHGIGDAYGNYYFLPRDARESDIARVANEQAGNADSLIGWESIIEALRGASGKRLLIVDTCKAENVQGTFDAQWLQKRSASSLFSVLVAAKGREESNEYPAGRHGLFTYALLEGLRGAGDANKDGAITLPEAYGHAARRVSELRSETMAAQTPQMVPAEPLWELVLAKRQQSSSANQKIEYRR